MLGCINTVRHNKLKCIMQLTTYNFKRLNIIYQIGLIVPVSNMRKLVKSCFMKRASHVVHVDSRDIPGMRLFHELE